MMQSYACRLLKRYRRKRDHYRSILMLRGYVTWPQNLDVNHVLNIVSSIISWF